MSLTGNKECEDCLYYGRSYKWQDDDYCNKKECKVDAEQRACAAFLENSHDCCYDCENGRDMGLAFYCKVHKKKIKTPSSYYCNFFKY